MGADSRQPDRRRSDIAGAVRRAGKTRLPGGFVARGGDLSAIFLRAARCGETSVNPHGYERVTMNSAVLDILTTIAWSLLTGQCVGMPFPGPFS